MTDRCQLNLRLDGRRDLLETIKEVAAAEGLSVNAWVIRTLERAAANPTPKSEGTRLIPTVADIELLLDTMLDNKLAAKLASFEERLGKLRAARDGGDESLRQELEAVRAENQRLQIELGNLQSALELPFASDLLNQLKAKRKKTTVSLADIEAILEIIEESWDDTSVWH